MLAKSGTGEGSPAGPARRCQPTPCPRTSCRVQGNTRDHPQVQEALPLPRDPQWALADAGPPDAEHSRCESSAATGLRGLTDAVGGTGAQSPSSARARGWPQLRLQTVDTQSPQEEQGVYEGLGAWLHGGEARPTAAPQGLQAGPITHAVTGPEGPHSEQPEGAGGAGRKGCCEQAAGEQPPPRALPDPLVPTGLEGALQTGARGGHQVPQTLLVPGSHRPSLGPQARRHGPRKLSVHRL